MEHDNNDNNCSYRSDMTVTLIDSMGNDRSVVDAARVSTAGASTKESDPISEERLINYLVRERHGSPFEHNSMTFAVEAPIFVWREHMRHRIGFSYNEESGRYKTLDPVFYVPDRNRPLLQVGKVGSYSFVKGSKEQHDVVSESIINSSQHAYSLYQRMLSEGVAREVARMALPLNIYSTAYVTMNARSLMNFLTLRTRSVHSAFASYPQQEIEMVATEYELVFKSFMPLTHRAFISNGRVAP